MVAQPGGLGDGDLRVRVKGPVAAGRRDDDRTVEFRTKNLDAHIDLADIDEPPRPQLEFLETVTIGAQRHFVVDAGRHVAEMRGRNVLLHHRLEVEDIESLVQFGNHFARVARRPVDRIGPTQPFRESAMREQRTGGEILQQIAAIGGV